MIASGTIVFEHHQRMRARVRFVFPAVERASNGLRAVIVEHKVGMAPAAVQPALNSVLRLGNSRADRVLGSRTVRVGRGPGDVAFLLQPFSQFIIAAADVLPQDVAPGGFILAEIAGWACRCRGRRSPT